MPVRVLLSAFTVWLALAGAGESRARAVDRDAQERPTFTARSELVVLHVTVKDRRGATVPGLSGDVFTVYEDGVPQDVRFFSGADTPATIGLLIDNSTSMHNKREMVVAAALQFTEISNPEDELFVIAFNEHVREIWEPRTIRETHVASMRAVLTGNIGARGKTALYDALDQGLERLTTGQHNRQVLVVVSDGSDNASTTTVERVVARTQSSDASIFTVALVEPYDREGNPRLMRRLADETGGEAFRPRRIGDIPETLAHIARDIRAAYTIGYAPADTTRTGTLRNIRVHVQPPGGERWTVRTRTGYALTAER